VSALALEGRCTCPGCGTEAPFTTSELLGKLGRVLASHVAPARGTFELLGVRVAWGLAREHSLEPADETHEVPPELARHGVTAVRRDGEALVVRAAPPRHVAFGRWLSLAFLGGLGVLLLGTWLVMGWLEPGPDSFTPAQTAILLVPSAVATLVGAWQVYRRLDGSR
jgi:hypothetical protein